jgi:hypothetical protein
MNSLPKLLSNQIWQTIPIPVYKSTVFNNEYNYNEFNNHSNNTSPQKVNETKVNHIDLLFQQSYIDEYFAP